MKTIILLALVLASFSCFQMSQDQFFNQKVSYSCKNDLQYLKDDLYQIPEAFSSDFFYGTTLVAQSLNATRDAYFSCQDQIVNATEVFILMNIPQQYQYCGQNSLNLLEHIVQGVELIAEGENNWKQITRQVANLLNAIVDVADECEDPQYREYLEQSQFGANLEKNREKLPEIIDTCSNEVGQQLPMLKQVIDSGLDQTKAMLAIPSFYRVKMACYDPLFA